MIKELIKLFFHRNPEYLQEFDDMDLNLTYLTASKFEREYMDEVYILPELIYVDDIQYFKLNLDKWYKAILRRMQLQLYHNICSIKIHAFCLKGTISLLFGLCCSQSSIIFRAFYGTSLSRIPSFLNY